MTALSDSSVRPSVTTGPITGSRKIWEGMTLLNLEGGVKAKMAGEPDELPSGPFDAAYTVTRSRYSGQAELEIVDWKAGG